jgi:hypothetical protein
MTRRHGLVWASIVCSALLVGCGRSAHGSGHATTAAATATAAASVTPRDTGSLVCDETIGTARPGLTQLQVVLGVVALPTAPAYGALQTGRTGMRGRLRLFAKTGLLVKPHTRFELLVPAALRRRMAISWGNADDPPPRGRFLVNDCARGNATGARWLVYAGGYYVSHPGCLPLVVAAGGQRRRVRIGIGAPCAGQRPPPQPTQS